MNVKAQVIARKFIECLLEGQVIDLLIPKNIVDEESGEDCEDEESEDTNAVTRRLFQVDTAKSYAQTMAVIALQAELVTYNKTVSLRDVYYSLKHLFSKQSECNRTILEVGRLCELKRHEMGVIASAKGYVSGKIQFKFQSFGGDPDLVPWTDCENPTTDRRVMIGHQWISSVLAESDSSDNGGDGEDCVSPAQTCKDILYLRHSEAHRPLFIVVVEKEGVFHRLVEDELTSVVPCILVTGCGFPDVATRALVKKLGDFFQDIEVVGLCDYNPQGLALLMTYRMPSVSSSFEAKGLQVPLKWLGLKHPHILALRRGVSPAQIYQEQCSNEKSEDNSSLCHLLQPLSSHDVSKLNSMLHKQSMPAEYADELEWMLQGGVKCELEALYTLGLDCISELVACSLKHGVYESSM